MTYMFFYIYVKSVPIVQDCLELSLYPLELDADLQMFGDTYRSVGRQRNTVYLN